MFSEWVLGLWSVAGIGWWLISWRLVVANRTANLVSTGITEPREMLSIFKPLPPLKIGGLEGFERGLESFISQLDEKSELLLGVHEGDRGRVEFFLKRMRDSYPQARLEVVYRGERDEFPNPKIAWQKVLAACAQGELWLWSDADMVAPLGFIQGGREEFGRDRAGMLTFPYVVREVPSGPAFLDALFVNAEFYPGVLLLRRRGMVDFGLGAGMLFRRDDFLRKVEWPEIGTALADDFVLGQKLGPVRLSTMTLATCADVASWREALLHHLRWSKTVWWNRPAGSAARVVVLPVLGWALYVLFHLADIRAWVCLLGMMQVDAAFAGAICRRVGCRWGWRDFPALEGWSLWRAIVWLACWLPWPVVWRGRRWWGPKFSLAQIDT